MIPQPYAVLFCFPVYSMQVFTLTDLTGLAVDILQLLITFNGS